MFGMDKKIFFCLESKALPQEPSKKKEDPIIKMQPEFCLPFELEEIYTPQ